MPFVSVCSAAPVCEAKMDVLQKEIGRIIALVPGKNIDNCMTHIAGGANLFMSGQPAKALFCEIRMFGIAPKESKAQVVTELTDLFTRELDAEKIYINFLESNEWGTGGAYRG